jgi:hypothetical protein
MLAQIIEEMGYAQVHNSILLINVMIRRAVEFEQKASEYEEMRFYPVGHPRKLLIEKRNECFNEVLVELKNGTMEMEISYFRFLFHYVHIRRMQKKSNPFVKNLYRWNYQGRLNLPSKR